MNIKEREKEIIVRLHLLSLAFFFIEWFEKRVVT